MNNSILWVSFVDSLFWGGLRGAVVVALALSIPLELEYWYTVQSIGLWGCVIYIVCRGTYYFCSYAVDWVEGKLAFEHLHEHFRNLKSHLQIQPPNSNSLSAS